MADRLGGGDWQVSSKIDGVRGETGRFWVSFLDAVQIVRLMTRFGLIQEG